MHLEGENSTVDNFEFSTIVGIFDFRLSTFDFRLLTFDIRLSAFVSTFDIYGIFDFRHSTFTLL